MNYFGTDGIRGIPNKKLTAELAISVGKALKSLQNKSVCIATDTRISKDMLAHGIAAGALSMGLDVYYLGVLPTPGLIYYSKKHQMTGIMVTASHNPYTDNGIKVLNKGFKLSPNEEAIIENLIEHSSAYTEQVGTFYQVDGSLEYLDFLTQKQIKTNLKVALDCANGATSFVARKVFEKTIPNLLITCNEPDGYNINNQCGSTHLERLKQTVLENKCDIGFAFDGDGDRVLCVNSFGKTIDGDQLIYILARYLDSKDKLNHHQVVLSMMSNLGLIQDLKKRGIGVIETNVGDKYIVKALFENHLSVGGENSGHIILPDEFHTGDGMFVAGTILRILEETRTSIDDWLKDIVMYADSLTNIRVKDRQKVLDSKDLLNRIEEIKNELHQDCKIIVRASGTEELIRVTVMAKSEELVKKYSNELAHLVESI